MSKSKGSKDNGFIKRAYDKFKSKGQTNNFIKAAEFGPPEPPCNQKTLVGNEPIIIDTELLASKLLYSDLNDISITTFYKLFDKFMEHHEEIEKLYDAMMKRS